MVKLKYISFLGLLLFSSFGCDTIQPAEEGLLVVSFFPESNRPLPNVRVTQSVLLNRGNRLVDEVLVTDAEVTVLVAGRQYLFDPIVSQPGYYKSVQLDTVFSGSRFRIEVKKNEQTAWAEGILPPVISIDSTQYEAPIIPIEAVFADSLGFEVEAGFMYPVDISLFWPATVTFPQDTLFWIQAGVIPPAKFPSAVLDFFLKEESIIQESSIIQIWNQKKRWKGIYAVSVDSLNVEMPTHQIKIYAIRSNQDYAKYVASRGHPEFREPVHNVQGGLGIVAGISMDTLTLNIE